MAASKEVVITQKYFCYCNYVLLIKFWPCKFVWIQTVSPMIKLNEKLLTFLHNYCSLNLKSYMDWHHAYICMWYWSFAQFCEHLEWLNLTFAITLLWFNINDTQLANPLWCIVHDYWLCMIVPDFDYDWLFTNTNDSTNKGHRCMYSVMI